MLSLELFSQFAVALDGYLHIPFSLFSLRFLAPFVVQSLFLSIQESIPGQWRQDRLLPLQNLSIGLLGTMISEHDHDQVHCSMRE